MRIHPIRTGDVAIKTRQREASGTGARRQLRMITDREWTDPLPIHAWAIEHPEGVIVVDTGETARATQPGYFPRWHPYYRLGLRLRVSPADEIGPRLRALGIEPADVRRVVLTHLHTDHAGGLHDFPAAEILVSPVELAHASGRRGLLRGYPNNRWPSWFAPREVAFTDGPFGTFAQSMALTEAGDVVAVPTPGHTPGHLSVVAVDEGVSLFLAGDASYAEDLMLRGAVDGVSPDEGAARASLARIRAYAEERPTVYLPTHDPESERRLAMRLVTTAPG
jgi:N-acyl homoserine lactone hydrolase